MIYRDRETPTGKLPVDSIGLVLLVIWVGALQIMLDKGKDLDWFHSDQSSLSPSSPSRPGGIHRWELTDQHPVVDLRLFGRAISRSLPSPCRGYGVFFGNLVFLPLWLQQTWATPPLGLAWCSRPSDSSPSCSRRWWAQHHQGRSAHLLDRRFRLVRRRAVHALALQHQCRRCDADDPDAPAGRLDGGVFHSTGHAVIVGPVAQPIPAASGLFNFARISAGSFGASIATTFWDRRASLYHAQLVEHITAYDQASKQALVNMQASGMTHAQALERMNRMIDTQAFMMSANDVFYASAILFVVLIGVIWLARPGSRAPALRTPRRPRTSDAAEWGRRVGYNRAAFASHGPVAQSVRAEDS